MDPLYKKAIAQGVAGMAVSLATHCPSEICGELSLIE
jgi:hypothetical protein